MYRVELKVARFARNLAPSAVPNVPCGVESRAYSDGRKRGLWFLMYRVELKVSLSNEPHSKSSHCS